LPAASLYRPYAETCGTISGLFTNAGDAALLVHQVTTAASKMPLVASGSESIDGALDVSQFGTLIRSAASCLAPADSVVTGGKCAEIVKMAKLATQSASRVHSIHKPAAAVIHDPCTFMPVAWVRLRLRFALSAGAHFFVCSPTTLVSLLPLA